MRINDMYELLKFDEVMSHSINENILQNLSF